MKKLMAFMLLTAAPMLVQAVDTNTLDNNANIIIVDRHKHEENPRDVVGYFWSESTATLLPGPTGTLRPTIGDAVSWTVADSLHTDGLFIDLFSNTQIVIEHPGLYEVDYLVTGFPSRSNTAIIQSFQFAGYLNGSLINGSIYSPGQGMTTMVQEVAGQFLVSVDEKFSTFQLVNQTDVSVTLVNDIGTVDTTDFGDNISASVFIKKVGDIRRRH
jgi:hypothetical protein